MPPTNLSHKWSRLVQRPYTNNVVVTGVTTPALGGFVITLGGDQFTRLVRNMRRVVGGKVGGGPWISSREGYSSDSPSEPVSHCAAPSSTAWSWAALPPNDLPRGTAYARGKLGSATLEAGSVLACVHAAPRTHPPLVVFFSGFIVADFAALRKTGAAG